MSLEPELYTYEEWATTESAMYILNQVAKRVEEAKKKNVQKLEIDFEMNIVEDGITRPIRDLEVEYLRELLERNGYSVFEKSNGVFFDWFTDEERVKNKRRRIIFFVIMTIAVIGILLGQSWIYGLL